MAAGDPGGPVGTGNRGPKGAACVPLPTPGRGETAGKYRAPGAKTWVVYLIERAMDMVADRAWETRKRTFVRNEQGSVINHTQGMCHLGGATLDNEENYLIKTLFTGGLGMVCVSNQARI